MARKKNTLLRTLIPLFAILAGAGIVAAVAVNSSNQNKSSSTTTRGETAAPTELTSEAPDENTTRDFAESYEIPNNNNTEDESIAAEAKPAAEAMTEPVAPEPVAIVPIETDGWRARIFDDVPAASSIGSIDGADGNTVLIEFSPYGAGIASLKLGEGFFKDVGGTDHVEIQAQQSVPRQGKTNLTAVPFAALGVHIAETSQTIGLAASRVWRPVGAKPGVFEAFIEDNEGVAKFRIVRRYELIPGGFHFTIHRTIENLTDQSLTLTWSEAGPIDLPVPVTRYGGDKRRVRFGYLESPEAQGGFEFVTADGDLKGRASVLGKRIKNEQGYEHWDAVAPLWPTPKTQEKKQRLVWTAFTDRYFAVALFPIFDPASVTPGGEEKLFTDVSTIHRMVLNPYLPKKNADQTVMLTRVQETPETVPALSSSHRSLGVYAGPMLVNTLSADPLLESLNLNGLIAYNFGGPCGEMCTFSWLTYVLFAVLDFTHSFTGDWAIAIILLVLIVRTVLHPITKWSQVRLQRFSVQMQAIAPKQAKVREKYKDDQKRQQQEMAKLWQEEGINPAGALGCLPMLLQSPVWIALYATLYFAAELRHEPAFWGVFQNISGGKWMFLADLARPDRAVPLPKSMHFTPPIIGGIYGEIRSINLLPLLMGVVFYLHQKYLSPPPSASMTPEQESQQKIMRVMFPLMMPVFMYAAPSGLTIYFITNSTLGILENKYIRSSAEKKGLLDPEKIKAEKAAKRARTGKPAVGPSKAGGFMAKLQAMAEQGQAQQQVSKKKVQNTAKPSKPEVNPKNYKKRK